MTTILHLSSLPLVHALGWTLLHFLWQGALIALLLACALAILPTRGSQLRYALACAAMAFMIVLPLITFAILASQAPPPTQHFRLPSTYATSTPLLASAPAPPPEPWTIRCEQALNRSLPVDIAFWFAGMILLLARLNLALFATRRIKSLAVAPAPAELHPLLQRLQTRLGIQRTVRLLNSARVQAPIVIGWMRPAILLPIGCLTGMSTLQIEAVLAHELAHIRRHDYLIGLLQSIVEAVLFYHPAVWWVSSRIRREREHCCDDLAVSVTGDRLAFAKALTFLEERRCPAPAGSFGANGGVLKMRIARLLGVNQAPAFPQTAAIALLVLAASAAGLAAFGAARAQSAATQQNTSTSHPANHASLYQNWLTQDVRWIITPSEKQAFLRLKTNQQRDAFIRQFWQRRNPNPGSPANKFRQEHYRRIAYANMHFAQKPEPGWQTDRGHVYIVYGPPDSIDSHPSSGPGPIKPFQVWHYRSIRISVPAVKQQNSSAYKAQPPIISNDVDFRFVDECACGRYQLKSPWPSAAAAQSNPPPSTAPTNATPAQDRTHPSAAAPRQSSQAWIYGLGQTCSVTIVSSDLPQATQQQISHQLSGKKCVPRLLLDLVRQQLRERGYAESHVDIEHPAGLVGSSQTGPTNFSVHVSAGAQYTLGGIRVEGARAFSDKEILQQFPIHPGDIFNALEIAKGLDNLKKLYASRGYTHFGAIPTPQMDEKQHTLTLTLTIIEGQSTVDRSHAQPTPQSPATHQSARNPAQIS